MDDQVLPLTLTFENRPGYLYAHAKAMHTNRATAEYYLDQIAKKCAEVGCHRLMIFRDITQHLEIASMFPVASRLPTVLPGVKVAFVNPHTFNTRSLEFGRELIAKTGAAIGLFDNADDAEAWLLEKD